MDSNSRRHLILLIIRISTVRIRRHVFSSLQSRRFLTKTRRYIDRGRHLEKQRKRLRGRGRGSGEGRGGERRKRLPAKPMELSNAPQLVAPDYFSGNANTDNENRFHFFSGSLKLLPKITLARVWNGTLPGIDNSKEI